MVRLWSPWILRRSVTQQLRSCTGKRIMVGTWLQEISSSSQYPCKAKHNKMNKPFFSALDTVNDEKQFRHAQKRWVSECKCERRHWKQTSERKMWGKTLKCKHRERYQVTHEWAKGETELEYKMRSSRIEHTVPTGHNLHYFSCKVCSDIHQRVHSHPHPQILDWKNNCRFFS